MTVFVIQVSGGASTHEETQVDKWWKEPIEEGVYINYNWKERIARKETWENIKKSDKVILYCTGSVEPHSSQISHVFTITEVDLNDERAMMRLSEKKELTTGMSLDVIRKKIDDHELSKNMRKCGTQGFNIGKIEESDLETIMRWSELGRESEEQVEIKRESVMQKYFTVNPSRIEEGFVLVDPNDVLPEGAGIPDIVGKDSNDNYVVVELKPKIAEYGALGQLISYKGAIKEKTGELVRGIIIASDFDNKIKFGANMFDSDGIRLAELKKYKLNFQILDVT